MAGGLRFFGLAGCILVAILVFCGEASANLIVAPSDRFFVSASSGIAYLFAANLPVDLLAYSMALLLTCTYLGGSARRVPDGRRTFMTAVILSVILIAVTGSVIDFYLLYDSSPLYGDTMWYYFHFDLLNAVIGSLLVFASIFLVSFLLVRLSWLSSLVIASAIGVLNFVSWSSLTDGHGLVFEELLWISFILAVVSAVPVYGLIRWHERRCAVS